MASLRDVATVAGVSISTVSRALGHSSHPVSPELRERIRRIAEAVGYQVNPLGRALITRRLGIIGALVYDFRDSYYGEVIRGIEDACNSAGYFAVICNTDRNRDRELGYLRLLAAHRAAGVVFVSSGVEDPDYNAALSSCLQVLAENGGQAVAAAPTRLLIPRVVSDFRTGARQIASHVLAGCRGPVLILAGPRAECSVSERLSGYRDAFAAAGRDMDAEPFAWGGHSFRPAQEAVSEALRNGVQFGAVLATNDEMAAGALAALEAGGVRVPDEVIVAGFGDMRIASLLRPQLTTVRVPAYDLGLLGAQTVIDAVDRKVMPPAHRVLPTELMVRASTGGSSSISSLGIVTTLPTATAPPPGLL